MRLKLSVFLPVFICSYWLNAQCNLSIDQNKTDYYTCPGQSVQFNAIVLGGASPYSYSWSSSSSLSNGAIPNPVCNKPGGYKLQVTDKNGCLANTIYTLSLYPTYQYVTLGGDMEICQRDTAKLLIYNSDEDFSHIEWTPTIGINNLNSVNPFITPLETTIYSVKAIDHNGCESSDTIKITVNKLPIINIPDIGTTIKAGESVQFQGISIVEGKPPYAYNWENSDMALSVEDANKFILNPVFTPVTTSSFIIQVYDDNKCMAEDKIIVKVQ